MPRLPHQFRFQAFHLWLIAHYSPCRVADIGGGKGLLSYLLNQSGFQSTVIDPVYQELDYKYKDLSTGKRILLAPTQITSVPHINSPFSLGLGLNFDLLVGLHAHGSNMLALQAAQKYHLDVALVPCCVIDEPIIKEPHINWFGSLVDTAQNLGLNPLTDNLNIMGKSYILYTQNHK